MAYSITAVSPDGNYAKQIMARSVHYSAEPNEASTISLLVESQYADFWDESDSTNPLQLNSKLQVVAGTFSWVGYISSRSLIQDSGEQLIQIIARDMLGKLDNTDAMLAPDVDDLTAANQQVLFARSTPGLQISNVTLSGDLDDIGDIEYPYFPATTSTAWLDDGDSNSTTLGDAIDDVQTSIPGTTSNAGMLPAGLIKIGSEWIQYDGYIQDDSGVWWFHNCFRGALGTTAGGHSAEVAVVQKVSQKVHPAYPIYVEGNASGTWELIHPQLYTVQVEEGRFDFTNDPTTFREGGGSYSAIRATYAVFDENSNAITLKDVIDDLFGAPTSVGGPGFASTEAVADSALAGIRLSRVRAPRAMSTVEAIRRILDEVGLLKGATTDALMTRYKRSSNLIRVEPVEQNATPDYTYLNATSIDEDIDLDDVYSAVRVTYTSGADFNLVNGGYNQGRMWHPQKSDTAGSLSATIDGTMLLDPDDSTWAENTVMSGHQLTSTWLTDGRMSTGWGLTFASNPGNSVNALYAWFPGSPDLYRIRKVNFVFDASHTSETTNPVECSVYGVDAYTPGSPPTVGNEVQLAGGLTAKFAPSDTSSNTVVTVSSDNIYVDAKAIKIVFDGVPTDTVIGKRCIKIRELEVFGDRVKTVFVQITDQSHDDDPTLDSTYLYAPDSYAKLVNVNDHLDTHKVLHIDIGVATDNVALALGRLALQQALLLTQIKTYEIEGVDDTVPELNDTVLMPDKFMGVVIGIDVMWEGGSRTMRLRVIDFDSELV